jgi:hypothetical protein
MRSNAKLLSALTLALASSALGGCIITGGAQSGAYDPAYYNSEMNYGYTTSSAPGTVYYAGGYYGGVYYRPGYYTARAPFVSVYGQPSAYATPVAQPVYGGGGVIMQQPQGQATVVVQPSSATVAQPIR